jgi:hypothetical protein
MNVSKQKSHGKMGIFSEAGDSVPLKVTFTRGKFFPGLESKNEVIGMIKAYVC